MKQKIKFRGKSKKSKKWVYGYYVKEYDCIEDKTFHKIYVTNENEEEEGIVEIIPKTLERYSGFEDKNGYEIYFGNIVRQKLEDFICKKGWYWWYAEVKEVNGCVVINQLDFDYSTCKFPVDFTFL